MTDAPPPTTTPAPTPAAPRSWRNLAIMLVVLAVVSAGLWLDTRGRIGATQEGTLRRHVVCADGYLRDTVYFSILADEWPAIKTRLTARLG